MNYAEYLQSDHWRELRQEAIRYHGLRCGLTGFGLFRSEAQVHHWIYRNWIEVTIYDLWVVSGPAHKLIHHWSERGWIDMKNSERRVEMCKELFDQWLKGGQRPANRFYRKVSGFMAAKQRQRAEMLGLPKQKKKNKRKKPKARPRGFAIPRRIWSQASEQDRHRFAIGRM